MIDGERMLKLILAFLLLDLTATVSMVEMLWTLPAVLLVVRYGRRAWTCWRARHAATRRNEPFALRLHQQIRCERALCLTVIAELLCGVGILAMLQSPTEAAQAWEPIALVSAGFLFAIEWVLLLKGELIDRHERALAWLYQQQHAAGQDDVLGHMLEGAP